MAGSIATIISLYLSLSTIFSSPLNSEIDPDLDIGSDSTPFKISDAAYINPFKRISVPSIEKQDVVYQPLLSYSDEHDDEWGTEGEEELLTLEEIELKHKNRVSNSNKSSGIHRCKEYLNKDTKAYSIKGLDKEDDKNVFVKAAAYLCKFGYLSDDGDITEAIKDFQRFIKLEPTGILDDKTLKLMKLPRCGDSDKRTPINERRKKRWANSNRKWDKDELKYHIAKYSQDKQKTLSKKQQRTEIERAVALWSEVAQIDFKRSKKYAPDVDIILSFQTFYHRDDFSFDGEGGELAHAFLPEAGLIHFDDSEKWTAASDDGINLFTVAAHEVGHSLGLEHTSKRGALMSPFYDDFSIEKSINPDDIVSIQNLYGWRGTEVQYHCPTVIRWDTAFTEVKSGDSYSFFNEQVWKFDVNGLVAGFPKLAIMHFEGLPTVKIEASLAFKNGYSFLFSSDRYWKYNATNGRMARGYPRSLALWGIPRNTKINDVIRWPRNNYVYFFSFNKYYRYNSAKGKMDRGYPRPLHLWQGVPTNFDAAMTSMDGSYTFFFLYHYYFPFNNKIAKVNTDQVQQIKYSFFICEEEVSDDTDRARFLKTTMEEMNDTLNDKNWELFKSLEIDFKVPSSCPVYVLSWQLLLATLLCLLT